MCIISMLYLNNKRRAALLNEHLGLSWKNSGDGAEHAQIAKL